MEMYNPEIKNRYLEEIAESSKGVWKNLFQISYSMESILDRDLYAFSLDEIKELMQDINPKTPAAARSRGSHIKRYINWALGQGLYSTNINILESIELSWFEELVDNTKTLYIEEKTLYDIEEGLLYAQDAVIPRLAFEGLGLTEIANLHEDMIEWDNNILYLVDDNKGNRILKVSERCMQLIKEAHKQEEYISDNGEAEINKYISMYLCETGYILKNQSKIKNKHQEKAVSVQLIHKRLNVMKEHYNLPYVTSKTLNKSGQIKMMKDLLLREGQFSNVLFYEIAEHFNISKVNMRSSDQVYENYNITQMKDYINNETLLELYGEELKGIAFDISIKK